MTDNHGAASAANGDARPQRSVPEALAARGIHLKSYRHGEHRTACPRCSRSKHRPRDTALAVRIDDLGATWQCHRCDWSGAVRPHWNGPSWHRGRPAEQPSPSPPDPVTERKRELAQETWRQTEPITDGLPFAYFTECRGIRHWDCDRVRWHPRCPWGNGTTGCIVVPITDHATGYTVGIWRIWPSMTEPMKDRRMGLGPTKGNAARLFDAPGPELIIAEGVEDALAAYELYGRRFPAWAALSAGNMAALILPERIRSVLILADRDEPKEDGCQTGLNAAHELAQRLRREGRSAEVRWSKIGKDANDALRRRAS